LILAPPLCKKEHCTSSSRNPKFFIIIIRLLASFVHYNIYSNKYNRLMGKEADSIVLPWCIGLAGSRWLMEALLLFACSGFPPLRAMTVPGERGAVHAVP
jgi:hypothetical protein